MADLSHKNTFSISLDLNLSKIATICTTNLMLQLLRKLHEGNWMSKYVALWCIQNIQTIKCMVSVCLVFFLFLWKNWNHLICCCKHFRTSLQSNYTYIFSYIFISWIFSGISIASLKKYAWIFTIGFLWTFTRY